MTLAIACPKCGFAGRVPDRFRGQSIKCRQCGIAFRAGEPSQASTDTPETLPLAEPSPLAFTGQNTAETNAPEGDSFADLHHDEDRLPTRDAPLSNEWEVVRSGLNQLWWGSLTLLAGLMLFGLLGIVSSLGETALALTVEERLREGKATHLGGAPVLIRSLAVAGGNLFLFLILLAVALRVRGCWSCSQAPEDAAVRNLALGTACLDLVALGSLLVVLALFLRDAGLEGGLQRLLVLLLFALSRAKPLFDLPWVALTLLVVAALGGLAGLLGLLYRFGQSLGSPQLTGQALRYSLWFAAAVLVSGGGLLYRERLEARLRRMLQSGGWTDGAVAQYETYATTFWVTFAIHVSLVLTLLIKYLFLLALARDETARRARKWQPRD